mmetsp:Transcript_49919/g.128453  ORF Transcript_49919/g.128453 Transcript_49919/m.128453 type:complete len:88 (-) Transcript_49919:1525-1788(-)
MEECRAELVGLYLSLEPIVGKIFGFDEQEYDDIVFINWLNLLRSGLRSLYTFSPETNKWRQAHSQARFVILRWSMVFWSDRCFTLFA